MYSKIACSNQYRLFKPITQTRLRNADVTGRLSDRPIGLPSQIDRTLTELRGIRCRHLFSNLRAPRPTRYVSGEAGNPGRFTHPACRIRVSEICEGCLVAVDGVAAILSQVEYALRAHLLVPENLPEIATQLMVDGVDSPALRVLAGLDLSPVDPRDVTEQFTRVLKDFEVAAQPTAVYAEAIATLLSFAYVQGRISLHRLLKLGSQAAIVFDFPDQPEIMLFYEIGDEWGSGWGRSDGELKEVVTTAATGLAS